MEVNWSVRIALIFAVSDELELEKDPDLVVAVPLGVKADGERHDVQKSFFP
ncbi:methionyl-tRNA synthetase [Sesbania bispinosa]|nr:methionyl-tRNA synthetase [Sesbania bispinosa]